MSTLTNENWVISEELSSKHPEESTKQLVSSLSSSAKPITASDVGLFKANQSQEVFSPLSFSPPAYRCCLGSESLLKGDGTELTPPVASVFFFFCQKRPWIWTALHYSFSSRHFLQLVSHYTRVSVAHQRLLYIRWSELNVDFHMELTLLLILKSL